MIKNTHINYTIILRNCVIIMTHDCIICLCSSMYMNLFHQIRGGTRIHRLSYIVQFDVHGYKICVLIMTHDSILCLCSSIYVNLLHRIHGIGIRRLCPLFMFNSINQVFSEPAEQSCDLNAGNE